MKTKKKRLFDADQVCNTIHANLQNFRRKQTQAEVFSTGSVIAVIVAVIVVHFALSLVHNANEDFDKDAFEATVKISSVGFLPGTLSVKPMTRVYFENHDSHDHRLMPTVK